MRRRGFIAGLAGAALTRPFGVWAQPSTPVIGFLSSGSPNLRVALTAAFRGGLMQAGYVEGQNVAIEFRWAEDHYDRLPAMAADLVRAPVAVIAAMTLPAALAAKAATTVIPIVFFSGGDPVEDGLVSSLSRPSGNLTGVALYLNRLGAKRLELLRELLPAARAFALMVNPTNQNAAGQIADAEAAARGIGVQLRVFQAASGSDFPKIFATLADQQIEGMILGADPFFRSLRNELIALAERRRILVIYYDREYAADGGLISYGNRIDDAYHDVGVYVGKILKGAAPADLPVAQPTKFELVINLKAAKAFGLRVPPTLLARADEVIE